MIERVESALPPEDWERIARLRPTQLSGESNELWRMALTVLQAEGPAACIAVVMALLPDDHPLKITRAKVNAVREVIRMARDSDSYAMGTDQHFSGSEDGAEGTSVRLATELCDALVAVLPPE